MSFGLTHGRAHGRYHVFGARPGPAHELRKQPTLSGHDWPARDNDVELPQPTLLELNGNP